MIPRIVEPDTMHAVQENSVMKKNMVTNCRISADSKARMTADMERPIPQEYLVWSPDGKVR